MSGFVLAVVLVAFFIAVLVLWFEGTNWVLVSGGGASGESFVDWIRGSLSGEPAAQLTCVVVDDSGNKYCVRDRAKKRQAADLIARVAASCRKLVDALKTSHPDHPVTARLAANFDERKLTETLPNSVYEAYTENKGDKVAVCLTPEKDTDDFGLIDEHTLTFVALHELAHIGTTSVGHDADFWENFRFLLLEAKNLGIHDPVDYRKTPARYCSMDITDNPLFRDKGEAPSGNIDAKSDAH